MYKFCPHCGKPFVEPSEPRQLDLATCAHSAITWAQVGEWSDRYKASAHFEIGDEISDTLKTGEEVVFVVVGKDMYQPGDVIFGLKDCLKTPYRMNATGINEGGWTACDMRRYLSEEVFEQLPDDLRAIIKPRAIQGGFDLLWLFSEMEIFGEEDWTEKDADRGAQMPYFKRRGNRIKGLGKDGPANDWWERSPRASYSDSFCHVNSSGVATSNNAYNSYGVAFGFCV